jgi:hypothetical protein
LLLEENNIGGKNMMKKITNKMLCLFFITMLLPIVPVLGQQDEIVDQSTPLGYQGYICGVNNRFLAQSFKPKLSTLSKIELGLFKDENITGNFTISIRQRLNGDDLVSTSISFEDVPWLNYGNWVTIDFEDLTVKPNTRYYIVFSSHDIRNIHWIMTYYTPYWRGRPWSLGGAIPFWVPICFIVTKLPDLCFRTYGYNAIES